MLLLYSKSFIGADANMTFFPGGANLDACRLRAADLPSVRSLVGSGEAPIRHSKIGGGDPNERAPEPRGNGRATSCKNLFVPIFGSPHESTWFFGGFKISSSLGFTVLMWTSSAFAIQIIAKPSQQDVNTWVAGKTETPNMWQNIAKSYDKSR